MLFTIGLLLLLTPFHSFQTTTNEKRESTESDVTKLTLSKPKPTAALAKQTIRPSLKPNTVNQTVLPTPVINQKPPTVNTTVTAKNKLISAIVQPTPLPAVKATTPSDTITGKDKSTASVNQAVVIKSNSTSDVKNSKDKPAPSIGQTVLSTPAKAVKASGAGEDKDKVTISANRTTVIKVQSSISKTIKDKFQIPLVNQTVSLKLSLGKNRSAATGTPGIQSTSTKSASASGSKTIKDKLHHSANHTVSIKSQSFSEVKGTKDKPAPTGAADIQSPSTKSTVKTIKDKRHHSANDTVSVKSPSGGEVRHSKDKPAPTRATNVQSPSTKSASTKTIKDKLHHSTNDTISVKSVSGGEVRHSEDKPAPTRATNIQSSSIRSSSASGAKITKEKLQPLVNNTVSVKSHSISEVKPSKEIPEPSGVKESTNLPSASGAKTIKEKLQPLVNQTISVKPALTDDGKTSKENPVLTVVQNVQQMSTSTKATPASGTKTIKNKPTTSVNQTLVNKSPSTSDVKNSKDQPSHSSVRSAPAKTVSSSGSAVYKDEVTTSANHTTVPKVPTATKENPAPSQPIKVVISNDCGSSNAKDQELKLQPGAPLVMTHKISLLPGGCTGECEAEMATLKGRVARLEREMSLLKEKCPCSGNCPDNCSGNGECEKGKCVCHRGFVGPDCSKCVQGAECIKAVKGKTQETVETETQKLNEDKENTQEKTTKVEQVKVMEADIPNASTTVKPKVARTQEKQEDFFNKTKTTKSSSSATKTSRSAVLTHEGRQQEETGKHKTVSVSKNVPKQPGVKIGNEEFATTTTKSDQLKDEPHSNLTQSIEKKSDGTAKIVTTLTKGLGTNKTRTGKGTLEKSILTERNATKSHKPIKTEKVDTANVQSVDKNIEAGKIGKEKTTQGSQSVVNATSRTVLQKKTITHGPGGRRGIGGSGLGSVKVVNVSSYSFTLTWLAPQGMFKNFTVIRREPRIENDEDDHEEFEEQALEGESANTVAKTAASRGTADSKRISIVVPGSVRSVEFSNLRANTRYVLQIYGTAAAKRSKIHRATAVTGPESATDIVFSNVTEASLTVSWSKPKSTFTGFRVTYTNIATGESQFVTVDSRQSHVVLSKLSAGSSYNVSVTTTHGRAQSDALTSVITTVPAPPTHLQVVSVTDTRAMLQWTPSLGKVDRFIISYESSKTPNVTVTVTLPGNSVEHQLRGLQRGTLYTVKVLSQKDSLQSTAISATFSTANVVKASEVGPRSAVITWRTPTVAYHSYRLTYQVAGQAKREVILDPTITEYKLTGLLPMSRYIVLVQGEKGGQYTSVVTTEFITGKVRFPFPTECSQELLNGALQSGEVDIYPQGKEGQAVRVYCDMETVGGGWTVFQRRMNGNTDFYRTWREYRAGFGNLSEEFWLGNEMLHNLTSVGPVSLRVDMQYGNNTAYAHYTHFSIDSEEKHYALTVSGFTGTAGDSMKYHNGRPFSTWDKDPNSLGIHCAKAYMGGWWYKNCYKANLNGLYGINSKNQGIVWIDWKGKDFSIPFTEMKFRPTRFSPATHG